MTMNWKGVPMPENVEKGLATGFSNDPYVLGWKDGVTAALASRADEPTDSRADARRASLVLPTALDADHVRAFAHVLSEASDLARQAVRDMSGRDRAVLQFELSELSRIVEEEEQFRTTADRRSARTSADLDTV